MNSRRITTGLTAAGGHLSRSCGSRAHGAVQVPHGCSSAEPVKPLCVVIIQLRGVVPIGGKNFHHWGMESMGNFRSWRFGGQEGQGMVEYALILVLVSIVVIVVLLTMGNQINNVFSNVVVALGGS
jgi:pilus assembly protein Flp/PilA